MTTAKPSSSSSADVPAGKVHNVSDKNRAALLKASKGLGDVVMDLRGSQYLPPRERAVVESRPRTTAAIPIEKPQEDPKATVPWFYNPSNPASSVLPADMPVSRFVEINKAAKAIDRNMAFTFNPEERCWELWYYKPGFSVFGNGWVMMKQFEPFRNTAYIVEVLKFMDMQSRGISLKELYEQKQRERVEARDKKRRDRIERDKDLAAEVYDYTSIKNKGSGNKFTRFHQ